MDLAAAVCHQDVEDDGILACIRLGRMHECLGVSIPRQTLCGWSALCSDACGQLVEHIKRDEFCQGLCPD